MENANLNVTTTCLHGPPSIKMLGTLKFGRRSLGQCTYHKICIILLFKPHNDDRVFNRTSYIA